MNKGSSVVVNAALDEKAVAVIKGLVIDGVGKANSGHPGGAMSSADFAYILFKEFLNYDPSDALWFNRDRFVLSAGHESMLIYSLQTLLGRFDIEDLKNFRQFKSITPGHPEVDQKRGIEATTGPLGQGFGMAGGMAIAEAMLQPILGEDLIDHYTYVIAGDGDLQEPVALGAAEIAGHFGLGKLIVFYDKNDIQISGKTTRSDSTDFSVVFQGLGWQVININGHSHQEIREAVLQAKADDSKPTIIIGHTTMAKGSATLEGSHNTHGAPFSPDETKATKEKMGLPADESFYLPEDVLSHFRSRSNELQEKVKEWKSKLQAKLEQSAEFKEKWSTIVEDQAPSLNLPVFEAGENIATRVAFSKVLEALADQVPHLAGGSADLEPSNGTKAFMQKVKDFTKEDRSGRNFAFGVREFPMGTMVNGMSLHGGVIPFGATFLAFADYVRPALRLSAIQELPVIHVFTHDSFYVGEDGPTHQPIEHLASLRAIPNFLVLRPADANETAVALEVALEQKDRPSAVILTRQNLPVIDRAKNSAANEAKKGGYVLYNSKGGNPDIILIASGSEVSLALAVADELKDHSVRVVNMFSTELFDEQPESYQESVLPQAAAFRFSIEAASTQGWHKYVGSSGHIFGIDTFGGSAPAGELAKEYGFTGRITSKRWALEKYHDFKNK